MMQGSDSRPTPATRRAEPSTAAEFPPPDRLIPSSVRAVFDGIVDGVIICDDKGNLLDWNPAALNLHGYTNPAEPRRHFETFHETFALYFEDGGPAIPLSEWPVARALRREQVRNCVHRVDRLDTKHSWIIRYDCVWTEMETGDRSLLVLTLRDITAERLGENALRDTQRQLERLMENLPQLVWTCRRDGTCNYLGPQWVSYTGLTAANNRAEGWLTAIHPNDLQQVKTAWSQAQRQESTLDREFRILRNDGVYRWFKTRAVPLRDESGKLTGWLGTSTDVDDQRNASNSIAVLAAIVEHSNDAILGKSLDGIITSWNRAAEELFGFRADEAIGKDVSLIVPEDRLDEERMFLQHIREGHGLEHRESTRVRKDGRAIDVQLTISPVRDEDDRIIGASTIARDITAARQAAEALRASEDRFRRLADAMPQIVWTSTPDGTTTYLNERWTENSGVADGASAGERRTPIHPDDRDAIYAQWEEARRSGKPYEAEFRMRNVTGGPYRWYLARAVPVLDKRGEIVEWFGTLTDIEDLKRAEASARENEARLRGVLEGAVEAIVTIDEIGTIETVNPSVVRMFGYTPDEMIGKNVRMLMPDPFASGHDGYLDNYRKTGERRIIGIGREVIAQRKDMSTFPVDLSVSEVYFGGRRIFTGMIRDITARKTAEELARVRQSELAHLERVRTMGQMAAGLAHELNQPLGAIANYAYACRRMLANVPDAPPRVSAILDDVQSEALRAGTIIDRLRSFVRKQQPHPQTLNANQLVEDAIRLMAFDLRVADILPDLAFEDSLPDVLADRVQIGQVLVNLIRNALDAMLTTPVADRRLRVEASRAGEAFVKIAIIDRGCGIKPDDMQRVFESFYTTKSTGLGVGLALCRTIIEDHGGQLGLESNADGGTSFSFTLRTTLLGSAEGNGQS